MTKLQRRVRDLRKLCAELDERAEMAREARVKRSASECEDAMKLRKELEVAERELKQRGNE